MFILNYKNDHQRKDVNLETNSSNYNKGMETGTIHLNGVFVQQMMIMEAFLFQMQISNKLHLIGKDDIKLQPTDLCRLKRSSSLSHWLNPRSSSNMYNLLKFANAVKHCTYLQLVCVNLRGLGTFYVLSFRLFVMLANALN